MSSTSYDPTFANNQSTSSTTVTGGVDGAVPSVSAISPNLVEFGSGLHPTMAAMASIGCSIRGP